jgi:perosamine synthetase
MIPYARQHIDDEDIAAVVAVLRSDWLTTGPGVEAFENNVAAFTGATYGVAVSSGTAALHAAMHALGIGPGDEVIVPAITFAATSNAILYVGGIPVFADVDPETLLISPESVAQKLSSHTKAIVAVDYAGQPCDYDELHRIASDRTLPIVADACHALGATYNGCKVGTLADLTVLSFHPVKQITTAEGGMVLTHDRELADRIRRFRNHGLSHTAREREAARSWEYDMVDIGYNFRLSDLQCALGISQLAKLPGWLDRRRAIAARYDCAFQDGLLVPLRVQKNVQHAYHLYVASLSPAAQAGCTRQQLFTELRSRGIGANVHYKPVYLHSYYRTRLGFEPGLCPAAEEAYESMISLPMFPDLTDADVDRICRDVAAIVRNALVCGNR